MPGATLPTSQTCSLLHTHRKLTGAHLSGPSQEAGCCPRHSQERTRKGCEADGQVGGCWLNAPPSPVKVRSPNAASAGYLAEWLKGPGSGLQG